MRNANHKTYQHGAYHPPSCYTRLTQKLEAAGLEIVTPRLASLGEGVVGKTLDDDVAAVQTAAEALFAAGKEVVLVAHSYGGFVAINTVNKLSRSPKHVVYISAAFKAKGATCNDSCNPSSALPPDFDATFAITMVGEQVRVDPAVIQILLRHGGTKADHFLPGLGDTQGRRSREAVLSAAGVQGGRR